MVLGSNPFKTYLMKICAKTKAKLTKRRNNLTDTISKMKYQDGKKVQILYYIFLYLHKGLKQPAPSGSKRQIFQISGEERLSMGYIQSYSCWVGTFKTMWMNFHDQSIH